MPATQTDDPSAAGGGDATVTPVVGTSGAAPQLVVRKRDRLAVDADGDGEPSPGDTLSYEVNIANAGAGASTAVVLTDTPGANTTLVAGSVQNSTGGAIETGNASGATGVKVRLDRLAAYSSSTTTFQVKVAETLPAGVDRVANQASVTSAELAPVLSVDPDAGGAAGPTETLLALPPLPAPAIGGVAPADGAVVTAPTPVSASITPPAGQTVEKSCVHVREVNSGVTKTVRCATGAPTGPLATLDPTTLPNGSYELIVELTASGGGVGVEKSTFSVEGRLKPGRFTTTYRDMEVNVGNLPITVTRSYDSFDTSQTNSGIGWKVGIESAKIATSRPLGSGGWTWQSSGCSTLMGSSFCLSRDFKDLSSHKVTVTWPDGKTDAWDFTPVAGSGGIYYDASAAFTARAGTTAKLQLVGDSTLQFWGDGNLYDADGETLFDPSLFLVTTTDGRQYELSTKDGLRSLTNPWGERLTIDESGVHSSLGTSVDFTRDAQGRITRVDGPSGEKRTYVFSNAGDLAAVKDSLNHTVGYEYDADHNLTKTIDPSGRPLRTIQYDADGRMSKITDGAGNTVELDVSTDGRQQTVTSPDGRLTTIATSDDRGNVTRSDKVHDGQTRTTRYEYDAFDHLTRETNPLGQSTTSTYDANGNRTASTDAAGNTTRYGYDASNRLVKATAPDGGATELTRDEFGSITQLKDPLGKVQRFEYDSRGNQTAQIDALGRTVRTEYDTRGNAVRTTDASGISATSTYDGAGRLASIAAPGLGTTRLQYDDEGQLTAMIDAAGGTTRYSYDALGRRTGVTDQLGRSGPSSRADGRELRLRLLMDQSGGVVARYRYDSYGQIAGTSGSATSPYTYTGREWDADASMYDYRARAYDPASGRFLSPDPVPAANLYPYASGNPIELFDPTGRMSMNEALEVPIFQQAIIGTVMGGVSQFLQCGWDTGKIAEEAGKGLLGGLIGGAVGGKLYNRMGRLGNPPSATTARFNLALANFAGAGLSVVLLDALSFDPAFDPSAVAGGGLFGGLSAAAGAGSTLPVSLVGVGAGLLGALGVELGREVPGGPDRCS